jgi:hypothetical protein
VELDISRGEQVEAELDAMIRRRHDCRVADEGERPALEMWREANRQAWTSYHEGQAERHRRTLQDLIAHHEAQAAKLCKLVED